MTSVTKNGVVIKKVDYPNDRTEVITDEVGNTTRIQRNEKYDPIAITDGEGNTTRIEYNGYWKVAKITDPLGSITTFDYNDKQDLTTVTDPLGRKTLLEYDTFGNVTKMTKGEGVTQAVTTYDYDTRGNVTKVTDPLGNITILGYDTYGHVTKVIDANGNVTTITNDLLGNPVTIEDPLGNKRTFSYDKKDNVTSVTDPLKRTSSFTYDFKGRVTSTTDPLGNKTTLTYDGEGNLIEKKELAGTANEKASTFVYDYRNRLQSATDPMGNTTTYDYTGAGSCLSCDDGEIDNPTRITDPLGNVIRKLYNKTGKLTSVTDSLNNAASIIRDAIGRPTRTTDANGNSTSYQYDSLGRITSQTDANGGTTEFGYDDKDNLITFTDPNGNTTTFDYDLNDRRIREMRPMGQVTEYTYYANGLLRTVKDAKGLVTTFVYDTASRLVEMQYADGKKTTFGYDVVGNTTSYANNWLVGTIIYNELGKKLSETVNFGSFSKNYNYTYDASGNKASFTNSEGNVYTYKYNKNNQLVAIGFDDKVIGLTYQWDRLTKTQLPNGVTTDYQYNANSWLATITLRNSVAILANNQYGFDKVGNIIGKTTAVGTHSYSYDTTYQLISATSPALLGESFTYDKVGNRLSLTTGTNTSSYTSNANNELIDFGGTSYTYDANGNTKTIVVNDQITVFDYNWEGRLETVYLPDDKMSTYAYDPFGRRIKKQIKSEITYYLYSEEGLIGEYDSAGNLKKSYGWLPNSIWGTNPIFMIENGNYYFYQNDYLGTPQKMTDENSNIVWSATYTVFGKANIDSASVINNNLRLPGQYYDQETDFSYNYYRDYDPSIGRYLEADPIGLWGGFNLYSYSRSNPVNMVDPLGLFSCNSNGTVDPDGVPRTPSEGAAAWAQYQFEHNNKNYTYGSNSNGGKNTWKCNSFVRDAMQKGGGLKGSQLPKHYINGKKQWTFATANELADKTKNKGVLKVGNGSVGNIVAWASSDGSGHSGIIGCDGKIYSAAKNQILRWNKTTWLSYNQIANYVFTGRPKVYRSY